MSRDEKRREESTEASLADEHARQRSLEGGRWKVVQCEQAEELCKKRLDAAKVNKQTACSKTLESF